MTWISKTRRYNFGWKILDEKFGSYSPCYTSKNSNADLGPILSIHQACFLCDIHNVRFLDLYEIFFIEIMKFSAIPNLEK